MLRRHEHYTVQEMGCGRRRGRQKLSETYQMTFSCFTVFSFILLLLFVDFITCQMS